MKTYKVFISHSWKHVKDLNQLRSLLEKRGYFKVEFTEVPPSESINSTNSNYIKSKLRTKIRESDIVLGIAGVYASYSDWIDWELSMAKKNGKSVIGVIPYGSKRVSSTVSKYALKTVKWNTESIVAAIRDYS